MWHVMELHMIQLTILTKMERERERGLLTVPETSSYPPTHYPSTSGAPEMKQFTQHTHRERLYQYIHTV